MSGRSFAAIAVVAAGLACLLTWPLVLTPASRLHGSPFGEVDNHFWMLWRAGAGAGPFSNWPGGWEIPFMDPVNRIWALGPPVLAYNLVILANLALAGLGGWVFARELTGSDRSAWVGLVALEASPFLCGIADFGITESLPVGWLALAAAAALAFGRAGGVRRLLAYATALTAFLASGWYHTAFAIPVAAYLAGWAAARGGRLRGAAVVLAGAIAGATRIPSLLDFLEHRDLWASRFKGVVADFAPAGAPPDPQRSGFDLLQLFHPRLDTEPVSNACYLGLVVVVLACLGLSSRAARAALALAGGLCILSLGTRLRVAGYETGLLMPAGWLVTGVPAMGAITHWGRALGPASVFLAAAAAVGAHRFASRPWVVPALCALIVVDSVAFSSTAFPRTSYAPDPPPALLALPAPGPLLELPVDDVGTFYDPPRSRRPSNQWQVWHGRPVAENYEGPDEALETPGVPAWNIACGFPGPRKLVAPTTLAQSLATAGFRYVVLYPELTRTPDRCARAISAVLGPPVVVDARVVAWDVPK